MRLIARCLIPLLLVGAHLPHASAESTAPAARAGTELRDSARWQGLREMLYGDREVRDGAGVLALDAPYRAHDAATVPIAIRVSKPQTTGSYVKTLTLLIDENPAPIAGRFHMTPATGDASLETRVRVNAYTNVRAVAEMNTGELYMVGRYVKASGGCSAPAMADQAAALARLGKIRLKQSPLLDGAAVASAQVMVSHPNSTGMQMDQVTHHYVPAHFVRSIDVSYGGESVLRVEGDISLSENPSVRFHFTPRDGAAMDVKVVDTENKVFQHRGERTRPTS